MLITDSYLPDSGTHGRHRPPVIWLKATLHLIELMACLASGGFGKSAQILQRAAQELDRFRL